VYHPLGVIVVSDPSTSVRFSEKTKRTAELLIKRHPHTLSHPKIYYEGIKAVIQQLNEKGEHFPEDPFDALVSDKEWEIEEIKKEIVVLENLKKNQKYEKKSPASKNVEQKRSGYHTEFILDDRGNKVPINVEDYPD